MSDMSSAQFDLGDVISKTFAVIGRHLAAFLIMAAILAGLPSLLPLALPLVMDVDPLGASGPLATLMPIIVQAVCSALLQGALTHATITDLGGQRVDAGASLRAGFALFLPLLGIGLLVGLGVGLGLILLVVPGLMLLCRWAVAAPVAVAERAGVGASMGRSAALTQGSRWRIFGLVVVYIIAAALLTGVEYLVSQATGGSSAISVIVTLITGTLAGVLSSTGVAAMYVELRRVKEGAVPEALASIFD